MSGSVTSPTAFNAYTNYTLNSLNLNSVMRQLATGVKGVVDDGAGVAISERMRSQANSTAKARGNVDNAISYLQTGDSWLSQVGDLLGRMHELAIDAGDATKTQTDRSNIQTEFSGLQSEIHRITTSAAKFNGKYMFSVGPGATQVGADSGQTITLISVDLATGAQAMSAYGSLSTVTWDDVTNTTTVNVSTAASNAADSLAGAINFIASTRAGVGAQQERMEKTRAGLLSYEDQIRTAESKIRTVDTAKESSEMMKYQILGQIGTAMLAQANQLPAASVQLVG